MANINFSPGRGSIVGTYVDIQYHDIIKDIKINLSNQKIVGNNGRIVTCMYWIVDKRFSLTNLQISNAFYATNISGVNSGAILSNGTSNDRYPTFVHTNLLNENVSTTVKFSNFIRRIKNSHAPDIIMNGNDYKIEGSRIFLAIVSNDGSGDILSHTLSDYQDLNTHYLSIPVSSSGTYYHKDGEIDTETSNFVSISSFGSIVYDLNVLHEYNDFTPDDGSDTSKPTKIRCNKISYRTWSEPKNDIIINDSTFTQKYLLSYLDGGENFSDVSINEVKITGSNDDELDKRSNSYYAKTHIINSNNNVANKFYIPEGRLSDVIYDQPANDEVVRWVFKRSRLKFTIPAYDKQTIIGLQVKTGVHSYEKNGNNSIYKNKEITISANANTPVNLVICPRDEGVLDNMPFEIVLRRKFPNRDWSISTTYKFHTYQRPTIDIAYPKIIRNDSTGTGFRYAKILANNNYSSFTEDDALLNKHVCDALTVMFGVPKNDESNIPIFVRYYLAEYRYGRNSKLTYKELNPKNNTLEYKDTTNTLQDLYRSNSDEDYVSLENILQNNNDKMKTAQVTNLFINDGRPLLISGRFSATDLAKIGQDYKLWTYKSWDKVYSSDILYDSNNQAIAKIDSNTGKVIKTNLDNLLSESARNWNNPDDDVSIYNNDIPVKNPWSQIVWRKNNTSSSDLVYAINDENPFSELWDHNGQIKINEEYALSTYGKWFNNDNTFVRNSNGDIDLKIFKVPIVKDILFRAGYIYLLRARSFHGAVSGAISEKYSKINNGHVIYGKPNTGFYDYNGSIYSNEEINYPDDNAVYGDEKPFKGWQGPNDGTSGISLPAKYDYYSDTSGNIINNNLSINKINQTYPGFSPVDYTIFEVVSPYVSKSNMIGIHPSTSEIGANQWITFSYRHLQKNIGSIDMYAFVNNETKNKHFGNKPSGVDNTITRIMHMYHSCIVNILTNYENARNRYVENVGDYNQSNNTFSETLTLSITPISTLNVNINSNSYDYKNTLNVSHTNDNVLIKEFTNTVKNNLVDKDFYNQLCGLKYFNNYRASQGGDFSSQDTSKWQEADIVWRSPKNGITGLLQDENHPLGNSYRWQVVINAMSNANSEIKIEGVKPPDTPTSNNSNYILNLNNADKTYHVDYNSDKAVGIDKTLQTKYYYEESQGYNPSGNTDISNNASHRFTINEFAGKTDDSTELANSPGSPVFYTTYSLKQEKDSQQNIYPQNDKYFRFFTNLEQEKSYGKLYMRIPKSQDCENGDVLTNNLSNLGNINKSAISSKNVNTQHAINNNNDNNALPLVRTTHYLYFTTYINTSFILKTEITRNYFIRSGTDGNGNPKYTSSSDTHTKYFNGSELVDVESYINYGTDGISKVYGEDNGGWGRCLSADDPTALKINLDGTIGNPTTSGGIEVPVLIRRTPLLQPELVLENIENNNYNPLAKIINIRTKANKYQFKLNFEGEDKYLEEYTMTLCYPFIPENNTYYTRNPNGGRTGVIYDKYQLDLDTDPYSNNNTTFGIQKQNLDFLGGYGICTGYTIILVPNNINISKAVTKKIFKSEEINQYFKDVKKKNNELYGRLEYFKLPANFYSKKDILNLQSIDKDSDNNSIVKPVLIAYNYQPESVSSYLEDGIEKTYNIYGIEDPIKFKGRNFQTIKINARNLTEGKVWFGNNSTASNNIHINNETTTFPLYNNDNTIKSGVIYDMLIIPVYSDNITKNYDFISNNSGEINGVKYGGNINDSNVIFSGSNPLVLNNYFAVEWINDPTPIPDPGPGPVPPPTIPTDKIYDTDACIVFPNVDIETYNLNDGIVNESPGFWLNNTFRLILRMPCFRTNTTRLWNSDTYTVENMSNNSENVGHDTNKFLFSDIQIHVGKLNDDNLGLDKIDDTNLLICGDTDQHKMNRIAHHIYSYKDFPQIFSKKLYEDNNDNRELLTAGILYPNNENLENNYKNRFIEVNLSLLDEFKTDYSEGYYIQFRWKSQYATGTDTSGWSGWLGGSCDGGLKWWQSSEGNNIDNNIDNKGCGYFVPVRNYTQIHTDFRNYIKESYPGSLIKSVFDEQLDTTLSENVDDNTLNDKYTFIKGEIGKGSRMSHGDTDNNSKTKPKNSIIRKYHLNGKGNSLNTNIVPTFITENNALKDIISDIDFNSLNNYKKVHHDVKTNGNIIIDKGFNIDDYILDNNQYMWELLYLDYIISNMCKLYFKYRYNNINDSESFTSSNGNKLYYGCQLPTGVNTLDWKCVGWSNTEFTLKDARSYNSQINATDDRQKVNIKEHEDTYDLGFNVNKYYRKVITKNDFDELNSHLDKLLTYIKNPNLCGYTNDNYNQIYPNGIKDIIPISNEYLIFEKHRKDIIGNDSIGSIGQSKTNNIYQLMIKNNYLQNIYNNIKAVCSANEIGNKDIEVDDYD